MVQPAHFAPPPPVAAVPKPKVETQEGGAVTGFFKSIFKSEAAETRSVAQPQVPAKAAPTGRPAQQPVTSERAAIPKRPVDVEALVAQHPFATRAEMLSALVSVNEFLHGTPRESVDAQRQILASAPAFAVPVFIAALQKQSPKLTELALDGLSRLDPARLPPIVEELLSSERVELRLVALRVAQWLDDEKARSLFDIASRDPSPDVRRRLVCYLSWRGTPWASLDLRGLCNDESLTVKWAAIGVLARTQPELAAELMGRTPPVGEDGSYRRRIEMALAKKKPEAGSSKPAAASSQASATPIIHPPAGKSASKARPRV